MRNHNAWNLANFYIQLTKKLSYLLMRWCSVNSGNWLHSLSTSCNIFSARYGNKAIERCCVHYAAKTYNAHRFKYCKTKILKILKILTFKRFKTYECLWWKLFLWILEENFVHKIHLRRTSTLPIYIKNGNGKIVHLKWGKNFFVVLSKWGNKSLNIYGNWKLKKCTIGDFFSVTY